MVVTMFFGEVRSVSGSPVATHGLDIVGGIIRKSVGLVEEPEMPGRVCLLGTIEGVVGVVCFVVVGVGDVVVVVVIMIGMVVERGFEVGLVGCTKTENNISMSLHTLFYVKLSITSTYICEHHINLMVQCDSRTHRCMHTNTSIHTDEQECTITSVCVHTSLE